jgi:hypothetical protein
MFKEWYSTRVIIMFAPTPPGVFDNYCHWVNPSPDGTLILPSIEGKY